jgi:hypothetical protein
VAQPVLEVGIGADLSPFEKAIGELRAEIRGLSSSIMQSGVQATGAYTQGMNRAGTATSGLTSFIREQRTESREQAFLFRQGVGVVGTITMSMLALSSATSGNSKDMQRLNSVLLAGYTSFEATNFAMSALGIASGGWATAVQLVVGLSASLFAFLNTGTGQIKEQKKAVDDLVEAYKSWQDRLSGTNAADAKISKEEAQSWTHKVSVLQQLSDVMTAGNLTDAQSITLMQQGVDIYNATSRSLVKQYVAYLTAHDAELKELTSLDQVNAALGDAKTKRDAAVAAMNAPPAVKAQKDQISFLDSLIELEKFATQGLAERIRLQLMLDMMKEPPPTPIEDFAQPNPFEQMMKGQSLGTMKGPKIEMPRDLQDPIFKTAVDGWLKSKSALDQYTESIQAMSDQWALATSDTIGGFNDMLKSFVDMARKMIAGFIAIGVAGAVKESLISTPFPFNVILAGLAGAAAATLFSSIVPKFAEGGLAYSPMLAVVGDNPRAASDPEVIAPLSKLRGMGGNMHLTGSFRINRRDLLLVLDQATDDRKTITGS